MRLSSLTEWSKPDKREYGPNRFFYNEMDRTYKLVFPCGCSILVPQTQLEDISSRRDVQDLTFDMSWMECATCDFNERHKDDFTDRY